MKPIDADGYKIEMIDDKGKVLETKYLTLMGRILLTRLFDSMGGSNAFDKGEFFIHMFKYYFEKSPLLNETIIELWLWANAPENEEQSYGCKVDAKKLKGLLSNALTYLRENPDWIGEKHIQVIDESNNSITQKIVEQLLEWIDKDGVENVNIVDALYYDYLGAHCHIIRDRRGSLIEAYQPKMIKENVRQF